MSKRLIDSNSLYFSDENLCVCRNLEACDLCDLSSWLTYDLRVYTASLRVEDDWLKKRKLFLCKEVCTLFLEFLLDL